MNRIKWLLLDVDGILTDGRLWYSEAGEVLKCFHVHDGQGLKELMRHGITVGIISGRDCKSLRVRLKELGITHTYLGVNDKLTIYNQIKAKENITDTEVAYMGDDVPDLEIMQKVALAITVPGAVSEIKAIAHRCTTREGGCGAVREACDLLLQQHRKK
jgi:3-deoxy-D-manno-octulosonate 8-phosphate phosphatase (KDO 8-P phosphatase)